MGTSIDDPIIPLPIRIILNLAAMSFLALSNMTADDFRAWTSWGAGMLLAGVSIYFRVVEHKRKKKHKAKKDEGQR